MDANEYEKLSKKKKRELQADDLGHHSGDPQKREPESL